MTKIQARKFNYENSRAKIQSQKFNLGAKIQAQKFQRKNPSADIGERKIKRNNSRMEMKFVDNYECRKVATQEIRTSAGN